MFDNMRRLHPRGAANRGICVDAKGAMLGPDCTLVRRTSQGYQSIERIDAWAIQKCLPGFGRDRYWLFHQCGRIGEALDRGELALAQIYGLRIPVNDLDDQKVKQLATVTHFLKAGFDPSQPRVLKAIPTAASGSTRAAPMLLPSTTIARRLFNSARTSA